MRDPGRERRAEQRARELLRSCVNDEEWGMYRDLGFIRVSGQMSRKRRGGGTAAAAEPDGGAGLHGGAGLDGGADLDDGSDLDAAGPGERAVGTPLMDSSGGSAGASGGLAAGSGGSAAASGGSAAATPSGGASGEAPYAYLIYPHKPIVAYVPKTGRLLSEYCVEFPDLTGAISQTRLPDSDDVLAKWMALTGDEERLIRNANMHLPGRQVDPGRVRRDLWRLSEWERQRRGSGPVRAPRS